MSILLPTSPATAVARAVAVWLIAVARKDAPLDVFVAEPDRSEAWVNGFGNGDERCRGSNQLLLMSKKQWSDQ